MQRNQRTMSIRKHILGKLKLNQIDCNPICPVKKAYRLNPNNKQFKRIPTIEQQIFSTTSIKLIKPYNSQKLINLQNQEYSICSVLKSPSYKKLQAKLAQMIQSFNKQKKKLTKDIKNIDKQIDYQTVNAGELCSRLMRLNDSYERLQNEYFEIRRRNYELRVEVNQRRRGTGVWNINMMSEPFDNRQMVDLDQMSYEQILQMQERLGKHNVGLGKDSIDKLPVVKLKDVQKYDVDISCNSEETNCCICCDTIQQNEKVIKLECSHIHHAACIKQWLKIKRFCPLCKGEVVLN